MDIKKMIDPKKALPLLLILILPIIILVQGRPRVFVPAGTWLYEKNSARFRPVWKVPRHLKGIIIDDYNRYRKIKLSDPGIALWAPSPTLRYTEQFPASLLLAIKEKRLSAKSAPFMNKTRTGGIYLLPWLYPAFFLFVGLFLLQKTWARTMAAILIGVFLFLYTLQTSTLHPPVRKPGYSILHN